MPPSSYEIDRKIEDSVKEVVSSSVKHAMRAPLRARFKDLPTSDMKEILLQRMLEENYDKGHAEHRIAYEADGASTGINPTRKKPSIHLGRNRVNSYAARITKMIADIEDRRHGPSDAMHNSP
ncbi:hypothetical protein Tco_0517657 [Tanacetum coccineum]